PCGPFGPGEAGQWVWRGGRDAHSDPSPSAWGSPDGSATKPWLTALPSPLALCRLTQVRWSRYNPSFVEPEVNKELYRKPWEELAEEEKEKLELKAVQPVKAAPPSKTSCSSENGVLVKTLEAIKRKQLEKYHKAPEDEKEKIECNPYVIFHQALKNCQPIIGLCSITKGGKTYQVPVPLKDNRKRFLAMKWLITECRENKNRRMLMPEKLSQELLQAFNNEGPIIKKKHVLHKMAEANRAYAHFRWW
uniref:Mitochondrial ribosomal protein S7 n=1 Tax=Accipiter nisus TaxID=211598 RepID=A0A8B9M8A6_9AVES